MHFYNGPGTLKNVPRHVSLLVDTSMDDNKRESAKAALTELVTNLDPTDFINVAVFNEQLVHSWHPDTQKKEELRANPEKNLSETFACTPANLASALKYIDDEFVAASNLTSAGGKELGLKEAIQAALDLDQGMWAADAIPANTINMIILVSDGHTGPGYDSADIDELMMVNKFTQYPILAVAVGNDANMPLMEDLVTTAGGFSCVENVIENSEVRDQLSCVVNNLRDVVLKDLQLNYFLRETTGSGKHQLPTTRSTFKQFSRGTAVMVAGRKSGLPVAKYGPEMAIEMKGQSSQGSYVNNLDYLPTPGQLGCKTADIKLCTLPALAGDCITLTSSQANIREPVNFEKKAVSAHINGTCGWVMYDKPGFRGQQLKLLPGVYEVLPGILYRSVASLRVVKVEEASAVKTSEDDTNDNFVSRLWAYTTLRDYMSKEAKGEPNLMSIGEALAISQKYNFLTPLTDINLIQDNVDETVAMVEPGSNM